MGKILEKWQVMPHGKLEELDPGLLTVTGEIRMPLGNFPRRMTVAALEGGRTAVWSAIALNEPEMAQIESLGTPSFLIVPGDAHRLDSQIWKSRYPRMKVLAPPGARQSVQEAVPVDATSDILDDPQVSFRIVEGTQGHEAALLVRRATGVTLVLNDIIGHVAHPHGLGANIMARLFGFGVAAPQIPRPVKSRTIDDPDALAAQFRGWALLPGLKRILVSHGDPIEADPVGVLMGLAKSLQSEEG
jgi:hypothetical protein